VLCGCVLFALPLLAHAYAGTSSRYVGDDYCAGYIYRDYGFIGGQKWFYLRWGAVPATVLLTAATAPAGVRLNPILPAAAIVAWVAAMTWTIRRITDRIGAPWDRVTSLLVAELLVFATIADAPNVIQSVYLRIPVFEYVGSLIALTWYVGFLARATASPGSPPSPAPAARNGGAAIVASAAATFFAGNLSPVYVALQTTALVLAWLWTLTQGRRDDSRALRPVLLAGLAGSIAALALTALAPGNAVRQSYFPPPGGPAAIVKWSVLSTLFMFARPILPLLRGTIAELVPLLVGSNPVWLPTALAMASSPLTWILIIGVPALLAFAVPAATPRAAGARGDDVRRRIRLVLAGAPIVAVILVMACMAPSAYGTSSPPPPRALVIPGFVMASLAACWGYTIGCWMRRVRKHHGWVVSTCGVALAAIAIWAASRETIETIHQGRALHAWAARWDDTDRRLRLARAHGERTVIVPAVESVGGVGSIGRDPTDWVNACAARYYGVETITGVEARP